MLKSTAMISGKVQVEIRGDKSQIKKELFALFVSLVKEGKVSFFEIEEIVKRGEDA